MPRARGGQGAGAAPRSRTLCGRTPGRCRNSRRASGVLRAARGQAAGPRDSASRNYNAPFTASVLRDSSSARPLAPLKRRPCRGRRFLPESRYSLSVLAVRCQRRHNKLRRVAEASPKAPPHSAKCVFGRSQRRTKTERKRSISALRIRGLRADRCHGDLAIRSRPKTRSSSPPRVSRTAATPRFRAPGEILSKHTSEF